MKLDYHWINLLVLFGALQGLLFSLILLFNKKHPGAKFLSVFMLVFAYNGFETFNWSAGLDRYIFFFDLFPFVLIYAVGPSLYLYVTTLLHPEKVLVTGNVLLHYIPVLFQFTFRFVMIVFVILWKTDLYRGSISPNDLDNAYWVYAEPLSVVTFLIYLGATLHVVRRKQKSDTIRLISKEAQQIVRRWVKALLGCMIVLGIAWPLTVLAPHFATFNTAEYYYPIEIALVFFIYWTALAGYHRTQQIYRQIPAANIPDPSQTEELLAKLRQAMEVDKLYLDPELTVSKVSAHVGISSKMISSVLNQHVEKSFNDFVNGYRVQQVQEKLIAQSNGNLTIYGIALEAGFNSQATFQRAFKNITGMSPREYMYQQLRKTA
jgi:AraC-like DNA-binding protein